LTLALRSDELAGRAHRATGRDPHDVGLIVRELGWRDDLQRVVTAAVVNREERQAGFRIAARADPAFDRQLVADRGGACENLRDARSFHEQGVTRLHRGERARVDMIDGCGGPSCSAAY
jgi:hypothetical protein